MTRLDLDYRLDSDTDTRREMKDTNELGDDWTSDSEPEDLAEKHRGDGRDSSSVATGSRRQRIDTERGRYGRCRLGNRRGAELYHSDTDNDITDSEEGGRGNEHNQHITREEEDRGQGSDRNDLRTGHTESAPTTDCTHTNTNTNLRPPSPLNNIDTNPNLPNPSTPPPPSRRSASSLLPLADVRRSSRPRPQKRVLSTGIDYSMVRTKRRATRHSSPPARSQPPAHEPPNPTLPSNHRAKRKSHPTPGRHDPPRRKTG